MLLTSVRLPAGNLEPRMGSVTPDKGLHVYLWSFRLPSAAPLAYRQCGPGNLLASKRRQVKRRADD